VELSVREAKAQFSAALAAAERGERVTVTRHGKPVAEIVPIVAETPEAFWERAARVRKRLGIEQDESMTGEAWMAWFNDPAFSRAVLGLED
jgi:prevent-host-death family protein